MAKRKKTTKSNTPIQELSKDCSWLEYMDKDAEKFFPSKEQWPERTIYSMYKSLDYQDKKGREPIDVMQFCRMYKVKYRALRHAIATEPKIKEAYEDFKLYLAANRRIGAAYRELDKDVIFKNQHHYDPEWDEVNKYHAALAAQAKVASETSKIPDIINIPTAVDTGIKPYKADE